MSTNVVNRRIIYSTPASSAFTPASLSGLIAWYSADFGAYNDAGVTLATNGQSVQQWNDRSGNGYNLSNGSAPARPTYQSTGFNGGPTLSFDPTNISNLSSAVNSVAMGAISAASAFMVGTMLTGTGSNSPGLTYAGNGLTAGSAWLDAGSAQFITRDSTNNAIATFQGSNEKAITAISLATNYRLGMIYDSVNVTAYVNNAAGTSNAQNNTFTSPGLLQVGWTSGTGWAGVTSEVVFTQNAISSGDRTLLDNYFKAKWGL